MKTPEISPAALQDIAELHAFIVTDSPRRAVDVVDEILARIEWLAQHPNAGRPRPEINPRLRGWSLHSWIVFYRPTRSGIRVIRVLHGSRDHSAAFRG